MAEIDYVTIAIITCMNTVMVIIVNRTFDLIEAWRKRLREELKKMKRQEETLERYRNGR